MPIHDQSYRRYGGGRSVPGRSWFVIARAGILTLVKNRIFLGLLLFAWFPFIVRTVQIYVTTNFPQELRALIPVGRMGTLDDLVDAILFLASEKSGFITGEILDVNGGLWCD